MPQNYFFNYSKELNDSFVTFDFYLNIRNKQAVAVRGSAAGNNLVGSHYAGPKWSYFCDMVFKGPVLSVYVNICKITSTSANVN